MDLSIQCIRVMLNPFGRLRYLGYRAVVSRVKRISVRKSGWESPFSQWSTYQTCTRSKCFPWNNLGDLPKNQASPARASHRTGDQTRGFIRVCKAAQLFACLSFDSHRAGDFPPRDGCRSLPCVAVLGRGRHDPKSRAAATATAAPPVQSGAVHPAGEYWCQCSASDVKLLIDISRLVLKGVDLAEEVQGGNGPDLPRSNDRDENCELSSLPSSRGCCACRIRRVRKPWNPLMLLHDDAVKSY